MATKKEVEKYLNLPWTYTIEPEGNYYIIYVNELPGICTDAKTIEEGMVEIKEAIHVAIELYLDQGKEVPLPIDRKKYKGNIAYRTSPEKHYLLAKMAKQKHLSINKIIDQLVEENLNTTRSPNPHR